MSGDAHLQLLRGDRALHDLRRAEHRLERAPGCDARARAAEGDVDGDDDVGVVEQQVVGQRIDRAAVDRGTGRRISTG